MKAALWYAKKDVRIEGIEETKVTKGGVKIKVKWCGICGSDLHEYLGGPIFIPVGQPHPLSGTTAPVVLGHEFPATIAQMNDVRIKDEGYITKRIHLDDIVEEGFGGLTGPEKKKHVKILVTPDKNLL